MKKSAVILLSLIMILGIAGCGDKGKDPNVGRYEGYQIEILGRMPIEEVFNEGDNYIELKPGGKGAFCLDGKPIAIKWSLDGEKLSITSGGKKCTATLKEGVISTDLFGEDTIITFVKKGPLNY